jgi:hypothetical protein
MRVSLRLVALLLAAPALVACQEAQRCRSELASAQETVKALDSKSIDSLGGAVAALDTAIAACDKAGLGAEREKLVQAKNEVGAHKALLERKAAQKKRGPLTPSELAKLVKEGDPSCPKGQAYKQGGGAGKEIRCTGPQLIDLSMADVKDYYATRRFKIQETTDPPRLRAEYGAELYVFTFDKPNDSAGAKCIEVYPAPGIPWREAVARTTGAPIDKVKAGASLKAKRGDLALRVEDTDKKQLARIGDCG